MADSIDKLRDGQPVGIGNKSNVKDWADYAKGNSFDQRQSKAQSNPFRMIPQEIKPLEMALSGVFDRPVFRYWGSTLALT